MNATKRKFNAILSSIGSRAPLTSNEKDRPLNESTRGDLIKKRRISDPLQISKYDSSGSKLLSRTQPSYSLAMPSKTYADAPTYAPWDRDEFLKRLKSFSSISNWTPKPARVNEVEWAKRGWICQKFERVRCCSCNVEIVVKLNKKDKNGKEEPVYVAHAIEEALVEKYVELIVTSHESNCLWRRRGCDNSIFKLTLHHPPTAINDLKKRYKEVKLSGDYLPYMHNFRTPDEFDLDRILRLLPKNFFIPGTSDSHNYSPIVTEKVALIMALFGWQGHQHDRFGSQPNSVSCHVCFRVLGLWIFKSKVIDETGEKVVGAAMNCLDVVGEHRVYCPWRNPISQSGIEGTKASSSESMSGWQVLLRVIRSEFSLLQNQSASSLQLLNDGDDPLDPRAEKKNSRCTRDEKDKEMRSRIMRVRSLFIHNRTKSSPRNTFSKPISQAQMT